MDTSEPLFYLRVFGRRVCPVNLIFRYDQGKRAGGGGGGGEEPAPSHASDRN